MSHLGDLIVEHGPWDEADTKLSVIAWQLSRADLNALRDELIELRAKAEALAAIAGWKVEGDEQGHEVYGTQLSCPDCWWFARSDGSTVDLTRLVEAAVEHRREKHPTAAPGATPEAEQGSAEGQGTTEAQRGAEANPVLGFCGPDDGLCRSCNFLGADVGCGGTYERECP